MKLGFGIFFMVLSYFLGCISTATILAKMHGVNIREEGSGNPGTTNVLRVLGKKAAVITLAADVLKGVIPVLLGATVSPLFAYACGVMAFIGHIWPFQFRFKGGKGVATGIGVIVAINPFLAMSLLGIFIVVVAVTKYVSLGSCLAALMAPACALLLEPQFFWFGILMAAIIIVKHRANIGRLVRGEESKLKFRKEEKQE